MAEIQIRETNVKITDILHLIGEGFTYEQIIKKYPMLSYADIMLSAKISEEIIGTMVKIWGEKLTSVKMEFVFKNGNFKSIDELKKTNPRAYAKWDGAEDNNLISLFKSGKSIKEISAIMQRTYGSIKSRLEKFELIQPS